ncbi:RHS repeat-associated core domain-containing protein [Stenotrophomonas sp.]|uniref:RHS repeat-associated core domain-containing protein n=1 Tax=Stenotrophomonas sp. TaxID=69392 RepID=UPI002896F720|nr:RHS repeat-associated core domain-containing protein [Stenotrophomonas sp.]
METTTGQDPVARASQEGLLACEYAYDATGLLARIALSGQSGERFWRGTHAVNELRTSASGSTQLTWLRAVGQPIVEQVSGAVTRLTLLATAISGSVLLEADTAVREVAYAPHGSRADGEGDDGGGETETAFNGELLDAASGCYLLGAGHHRPYSPRLGIFLAADGLSPFGAGGLNPYAYCAGDPVNRSDPTGHFWKWIVVAVGIAVGVAAVAVTFGAASKAVAAVATVGFSALTKSTAGAIASTTLGVVAVGAEVGAIAAEVSGDTKTAKILGFVGLALGIVAAGPAIAKAAAKGAAKFSRFSKRIATIRSQGLSGRGAARAGLDMAQETRARYSLETISIRDYTRSRATSIPWDDSTIERAGRSAAALPRNMDQPTFLNQPSAPAGGRPNVADPRMQGQVTPDLGGAIQNMNEAVPEVVQPSRAVRRPVSSEPPSYNDATLPTYESTLPPSYDSHRFT